VHGIFHQLYAPGFPAQQDRLMLVVDIEWSAEEEGRQEFRIDVLDPARSPALTINGHTEVGKRGEMEPPQLTRLLMPLEGVIFPAAGSYDFVLHAAGIEIPVTVLHLIEDPNA
jgi:hypothetical protein